MLTGGAKQMPPTNGGPKTAAGAKCDFITDGYLELPEFPALPKHFDKFESAPILPIPRLLPSLHHLQGIAPAEEGGASGLIATGSGFGVGLGIAVAAGLVWHCVVPARVRTARPSIRRVDAAAEDKPSRSQ